MSEASSQGTQERSILRTRLTHFIPAIDWMSSYSRVMLSDDISSGLIIAVMLIPQGIAFALLAGLPPIMGLYAAVIPPLFYAFFGTSNHLMVGPTAIISLLTLEAASNLAPKGTTEYVNLVVVLMLLAGVISLVLGFLRGGFIVRFISHGVVSGFTSAAAIIIAFSQIDNLLGISVDTEHSSFFTENNTFVDLYDITLEVVSTNWPTFLLGIGTVVLLIGYRELLRRLPPSILLIAARFPFTLLLIAGATAIVFVFGLNDRGVAIIGEIPSGLPTPTAPQVDRNELLELLPAAITISFIGFIESSSVARTIATREKRQLDANQELKALGIANIAGSFFSGYPVTGSFSRTAVAYQSGGKTQVTGLISAGFIILTLLFFTKLFFYLPLAVLAGIIIVAVSGLVNFKEMIHVFRLKRVDGWTVILTFLSTLILGVEYGVLIGVAFSLAVLIWRSAYPRTIEVGYVEDERVFRDLNYYPDAQTYPEVLIVRIDAPVYFANMIGLQNWIEQALHERPFVRTIIFDFTTVTDIDVVAVESFRDLMQSYRAAGISILFAGMRGPVKDIFSQSRWSLRYTKMLYFPTVESALNSRGIKLTKGPGWAEARLAALHPADVHTDDRD